MIQNTEPSAPKQNKNKASGKTYAGTKSPIYSGTRGTPPSTLDKVPIYSGQGGLPNLLWDKGDSPIYSGTRGTPPSTQDKVPHLLGTRSPIYSDKASHLLRQSIPSIRTKYYIFRGKAILAKDAKCTARSAAKGNSKA